MSFNFGGIGKISTQDILETLPSKLSASLEIPKIVDAISEILIQSAGPQKIAILTRDPNNSCYLIQQLAGFNEIDCQNLLKDCFSTSYLLESEKVSTLEKLKQDINSIEEGSKDKIKHLIFSMEQIEAEIIAPVVSNGQLIALIILGRKNSGSYNESDLKLLSSITTQAAVSLENALLYNQIYTLNQELQQKIGRATLELKEKNDQLREALERVESLDKLKDQLISITSHELRTPLSAIKSYLWMALYKSDIKLSERMNLYISRAFESSERMINLVNDILNVSRIEAGRIEVLPKVFDIAKLTQDVIAEISPKITEKQIELSTPSQPQFKVFADPDKVREVLLNLFSNALKFTPSGGKIAASFIGEGENTEISVTDNGAGIAKEDQGRLFTRFGRLDNSYITNVAEGTGLGLYISKSLVELMGGRIWVSSDGPGKGSTFSFTLPTATPKVLAEAEKFTKVVKDQPKSLEPVNISNV